MRFYDKQPNRILIDFNIFTVAACSYFIVISVRIQAMTMRIYALSRIYVRDPYTWPFLLYDSICYLGCVVTITVDPWARHKNYSIAITVAHMLKYTFSRQIQNILKWTRKKKKTCGKQRTHQYIEILISHIHTIRIYCGEAPCDVLPILYIAHSKHTSTDCFQFLSIQYIKQSSSKKVLYFFNT